MHQAYYEKNNISNLKTGWPVVEFHVHMLWLAAPPSHKIDKKCYGPWIESQFMISEWILSTIHKIIHKAQMS